VGTNGKPTPSISISPNRSNLKYKDKRIHIIALRISNRNKGWPFLFTDENIYHIS
jgi:hypothetical protein